MADKDSNDVLQKGTNMHQSSSKRRSNQVSGSVAEDCHLAAVP